MNRLAADQRGVIIVMFALMLPIMLGFVGLGVEVGYWFQKKRDMQAAADAAAVASAYEVAEGRSTGVQTIADREAVNNGYTGTVTVRSVPFNSLFPNSSTGVYSTDDDAVSVDLSESVVRLFSSWFLSGNLTINAHALADVVAGATDACVLALGSSNQSQALYVHGSAAVTMSGCTAATNSTDLNAVDTTTGLTVDCVFSAGGVNGTTDTSSISPAPNTTACSTARTNQPTITDPYDDVTLVTKPGVGDFSPCGALPASPISPGDSPFCSMSVNSTLIMSAGTYYINQGNFSLTGNAVIDATAGVTIVFGDSTGAGNCGGIDIQGNTNIDITAPTSGNFSGIALYRNSECDNGEDFVFNGNNDSNIIGAIYNPSAEIKLTGNGDIGGTCVQIIADQVEIVGDGTLGSDCDGVGTTDILAGGIGSLVE